MEKLQAINRLPLYKSVISTAPGAHHFRQPAVTNADTAPDKTRRTYHGAVRQGESLYEASVIMIQLIGAPPLIMMDAATNKQLATVTEPGAGSLAVSPGQRDAPDYRSHTGPVLMDD